MSPPFFTPVHSLVGGLMLASCVHTLLSQLGTVLGISGFFHTTVGSVVRPREWSDKEPIGDRTAIQTSRLFTAGLVTGGLLLRAQRVFLERHLGVSLFDSSQPLPVAQAVLFGALVGAGTKLGSGCTSGHFLCGLSRLSQRSIAATATFFSVAVATHLAASTPLAALTVRALSTAEVIRAPDLLSIALLQLPAIGYLLPVGNEGIAATLTAFATGIHFAFGLALTGMLRPSKVLGFLALSSARISSGEWDPSLALVAVGGILPAAYGYFNRVRHQAAPKLKSVSPTFRLPKTQQIDARLLGGAAAFGVGWGLSGLCPGPVIVSLPTFSHLAAFTAAMAAAGQIAALV